MQIPANARIVCQIAKFNVVRNPVNANRTEFNVRKKLFEVCLQSLTFSAVFTYNLY